MKIIIDRFDKEWSRLVRERDEYKCQICGKQSKYVNAHHFIRRAVLPTRLDIQNGISLCAQCHTFNSTFSAHQTPGEFKKWFKKNWPARAKILEDKAKGYMSRAEATEKFCWENRYQLSPALYKQVMKQRIKEEDGRN